MDVSPCGAQPLSCIPESPPATAPHPTPFLARSPNLVLVPHSKGRAREVASLKQRPPLRRGDVRGVMARIRADYANAYFVTGVIDGSVYEEDCLFVDPTISFSGLDLWRRNLQLLVPFLVAPTVQLKGLQRLARNDQGREVLKVGGARSGLARACAQAVRAAGWPQLLASCPGSSAGTLCPLLALCTLSMGWPHGLGRGQQQGCKA